METSVFGRLPDELLDAIVLYLSPKDTIAFGTTCARCNRITHEAVVWRRHCLNDYRYWDPTHQIRELINGPPAQTRWRELYKQRTQLDDEVLIEFDSMLRTQKKRLGRIETLAKRGYDIKDVMLRLVDKTPNDAEDVLARRYHAKLIIAKLHRDNAVAVWHRLATQQMVSLEDAIGAYDLFGTAGDYGDLHYITETFDDLATGVREHTPDFDTLSTRQKALAVAAYLREEQLLGNDDTLAYHALRNNYLTLALKRSPHRSLPLQSAVIYCGVARRLGIDARPANFPSHVYVVIQPPRDTNLDGRPTITSTEEREYMHVDPWRHANEVDRDQLLIVLRDMNVQEPVYRSFLGPAGTADIVLRAGRNITNSVVDARNRIRQNMGQIEPAERDDGVNKDRAWYSMLWAVMLLIDHRAAIMSRRLSTLPYLLEHYELHHPEDIGLIERYVLPLFVGTDHHDVVARSLMRARVADESGKLPTPRGAHTAHVKYKIGTFLLHKRYGYTGVVIGWDARCEAGDQWMSQMRVHDLPRGGEQPFYNVLADDQSIRYVAEENIELEELEPRDGLLAVAGKYFKRWDRQTRMFISNIRDDYPDD